MRKFREVASTIADFSASENAAMHDSGDKAPVNRLSGGATMWQARLVLSTLEPKSAWASRLRTAIRRGDEPLADQLLDEIYARNSNRTESTAAEQQPLASGPVSRTNTTVLPPAPITGDRAAS